METREFAALQADVEQYILDHPPISLHHKRARHHTLRRGPLSLSDRLLATVIRNRWRTQVRALTALLGSPREAVGDAVHEVTPLLEGLSHPIKPAPITAASAQDPAKLIGQNATKTISNWATAPCTGTRVGSAVRAQVFSGLSYFGGRSRASAASAGTNGSPQPDSWMPPRRNPCPDEGPERGPALSHRPQLPCWARALRAIRSWLTPAVTLNRWWRAWTDTDPPSELQALIDAVTTGHGIDLCRRI